MPTAVWISFVVMIVASLALVFIRSRRTSAQNPSPDLMRRRAVIDDCGDDVLWEVGKLRPIVDTRGLEAKLTKRSFFKRVAFTVSAFSVAWLASRGRKVAFGAESRSPEDHLLADSTFHTDFQTHADIHTDGGGGNHIDNHSDSPGAHVDICSI